MMAAPVCKVQVSGEELLRGLVDVDKLPKFRISGVATDSRQVEPGYLFIALSGLSTHAMDHAASAIEAGAVAVLYDSEDEYARQRIALLSKQLSAHWVAVPNLQKHTGEIASRFYGQPSRDVRLIGVTGTDGKTSVTHLLVQALMSLGQRAGSIGTLGYGLFNNLSETRHTTPDAVRIQQILAELKQAECDYVVMEVSSHALQQYRVSGCSFDVAVLTNLGSDHLDYHGSRENYAASKAKLFDLPELSARVLNMDDAFGVSLAQLHTTNAVAGYSSTIDSMKRADVVLLARQMSDAGLKIRVGVSTGEMDIQTRLIGDFNIDNCLACIAVLQALGFDHQQVEAAMQGLQPIPGRMEYLPARDGFPAVVIDFAHTEQALAACLKALTGIVQGELICVFGCGGDRDAAKRPLMAAAVERYADHVIVTDDNPRHEAPEKIMRDILQGFVEPGKVRVIHDREKAIKTALQQATTKDLVVIAGKGHEQVQIIGDQRLAFNDQQVVRQLRGELA